MRFTVVDENEFKKRCDKKKLKYVFQEFINMQVKVVEVNFTEREYISMRSAYNNLQVAAKRHCVPVQVKSVGDKLYFVRTDI